MESGSSSPDIKLKTRWKWKTPLFALVVIFTNAFGNFFIARGMRQLPALGHPADLIVAIFTPWVGLGIVLLITWLLSRMMFLSFADLSYMLPLTSLGYVLSAVLGHVFLNEQITTERWLGTGLIMVGTMLVGSGSPETTHHVADPAGAAAQLAEEIEHPAKRSGAKTRGWEREAERRGVKS
jgi:drug/metabolite transporter (DMT)-like permease